MSESKETIKITISRKVRFYKPVLNDKSRAETITNQYILEGSYEDIESMFRELLEFLKDEFTQQKRVK
jgi:23S rRNA maturation-related 3'-5' exoribonuclease YhaM